MPIPAAEARRIRVVAFAEELFVVRGFAGATIELAHRTGEVRSTIFKQMGRKADVLVLVAEAAERRAKAAIHEEHLAARRHARRRAKGEPRPDRAHYPLPPHVRSAHRAAHLALVRNRETALLVPVLLEARRAGMHQAHAVLRRWSATRRQAAAATLRAAGRHPRPGLVVSIAELSGPWPYLGLVVEGDWTAPGYETWLRGLVAGSVAPVGPLLGAA